MPQWMGSSISEAYLLSKYDTSWKATCSTRQSLYSKMNKQKETLKTFSEWCVSFSPPSHNIMGYRMGEVVAIRLLVVVGDVSQYYQCGNVCPIAILERYCCSVGWWFWQWKSEAISKSSFQESWGLIQIFFISLERFLFFCWALDLTNTSFSEWESKLLVDSVICFIQTSPYCFLSSVLCKKLSQVCKMCLWMSEITFWFG